MPYQQATNFSRLKFIKPFANAELMKNFGGCLDKRLYRFGCSRFIYRR